MGSDWLAFLFLSKHCATGDDNYISQFLSLLSCIVSRALICVYLLVYFCNILPSSSLYLMFPFKTMYECYISIINKNFYLIHIARYQNIWNQVRHRFALFFLIFFVNLVSHGMFHFKSLQSTKTPIGFVDKRSVKFYFVSYRKHRSKYFCVCQSLLAVVVVWCDIDRREKGAAARFRIASASCEAASDVARIERKRNTVAVAGTFLDYPYLRKFRARYAR